jgi:hypothetical protein
MFMFADTIFVSMIKSYHHNDTVDQQARARRLGLYLPRENIHHHRFGHLTLWRAYIIASLLVHHYIVSPVTMFRVLWRTQFKNLSISPWFIMTTFMFLLSIGYLCVGMCYMKTLTSLSFWRVEKVWILRVGKIIDIFSFMRMRRRNVYFFFIKISVVVWIKISFSPLFFKHVCIDNIVSSWVHPILSVDVVCVFAFSLHSALAKLAAGIFHRTRCV